MNWTGTLETNTKNISAEIIVNQYYSHNVNSTFCQWESNHPIGKKLTNLFKLVIRNIVILALKENKIILNPSHILHYRLIEQANRNPFFYRQALGARLGKIKYNLLF